MTDFAQHASLLDELDQRQDEELDRLEELDHEILQTIAVWTGGRKQALATTGPAQQPAAQESAPLLSAADTPACTR